VYAYCLVYFKNILVALLILDTQHTVDGFVIYPKTRHKFLLAYKIVY
jgi:hypothetical protein